MRTSPYISQVFAHGDRRKYLTALVTLDPEHIDRWARERGIDYDRLEELAEHPKVKKLIDQEVQERNEQLASFETVKKVRIVPGDFSIDSGELTPTLKIRRKVVTEKYQKLLDEMYEE